MGVWGAEDAQRLRRVLLQPPRWAGRPTRYTSERPLVHRHASSVMFDPTSDASADDELGFVVLSMTSG